MRSDIDAARGEVTTAMREGALTQHIEHLLDVLEFALGEPDGGDVGIGKTPFQFLPPLGIVGAGENRVVVWEGISADFLGDLGEGLDGAVGLVVDH